MTVQFFPGNRNILIKRREDDVIVRPVGPQKDKTQEKIEELINAYQQGEISNLFLGARLKSLGIEDCRISCPITFSYKGKSYKIKTVFTNMTNKSFELSTLKNIYKFSDEIINKYFCKSGDKYILQGASHIMEVAAKVAQECNNDLVIANFLNDKNKTRDKSIKETDRGGKLTAYTYLDYIDEISQTVGTDEKAMQKNVIDKVVKDYTNGNLVYEDLVDVLKAIGIDTTLYSTTDNNAKGISFNYNNKTYKLYCSASASKSSTDKITSTLYTTEMLSKTGATQEIIDKYFVSSTKIDNQVKNYILKTGCTYMAFLSEVEAKKIKTYTVSELKETYKFSDEIINKYFEKQTNSAMAKPNTTNASNNVYVLNTETGCKTIGDVEKVAVQEYQTKQVLINFLNDKNKKTDSATEMKKTSDNKELTVENYKNSADKINSALGNDEKAIKQKALEKFIKDYTQGNLSVSIVELIADSIGVKLTKIKQNTNDNEIGYQFEYNNKSYKVYCSSVANASGADNAKVTTYTANDLSKTGATKTQIDKYFTVASLINNSIETYHLKTGKRYDDFLAEVEAAQVKNGTFETKNDKNQKVETTYVNGVKTKVVTYNNSKGSTKISEIEYYNNGKVKSEIAYSSSGQKTSEKAYYENGKTKSEIAYSSSGQKTSEKTYYDSGKTKYEANYSWGQTLSATEYDKNGKVIYEYKKHGSGYIGTTYNSDGSSVGVIYDYDGKSTNKEIRIDKNGKKRCFVTETANDGTKTIYECSDEYFNKYTALGEEKYDKQGRLVSKYTNSGKTTQYVEYSYNNDGTYREVIYDSKNKSNITCDKSYNKNNKLLKVVNYYKYTGYYSSIEQYTYDTKGNMQSKTVTKYRNAKSHTKDSETVTDKNGTILSEKLYDTPWTDPNTGKKYSSANIVTTNNGTITTKSITISGKKFKDFITDSKDNTTTVVTYSNNVKSSSKKTDSKNNVLEEIKYDSNGNLSTKTTNTYENGRLVSSIAYDKNGNIQTKTFYEYSNDGKTVTKKLFDSKGNLKSKTVTEKSADKNSREKLTTKTFDANDKQLSTVYSYYSNDGKTRYEDTYETTKNNGLISNRKTYDTYGNVTKTYNYSYTNLVDNKNYTRITKDSSNNTVTTTVKNGVTTKQVTNKPNGDIYTEYFDEKTGKHTKSFYYTKASGTVKTTEYDANGNALSAAKNRIAKSDAIAGETTKIYEAIVDVDGQMYMGVSNLDAIKAGGAGDISIKLLRMAAKNYNGTPSGAKKLNSASEINEKYRTFATNLINDKLSEFGYNANQVKGYEFSNTSDVAKKMAADNDLKSFVKSNLKDLINGKGIPGKSFSFENNKDLYNAFHGVNVVDSSLSGTKLTLTIMDVYDFDPNAKGTNNGAKLNRIAAAAMKDGEIKPYYTLTKVTIDLTSLGYTAAQIQAMKA